MIYPREKLKNVTESLDSHFVTLLYGPRGAGQSTLLRELSKNVPSIYINLSRSGHFDRLKSPKQYLNLKKEKWVIIDECSHHPDLFSYLEEIHQLAVDGGKLKGFLIAGIHTQDLLGKVMKILGAKAYGVELAGLSPLEIEEPCREPLRRMRVRGGFPASYRAINDQRAASWRKRYINSYLQQDLKGPCGKIKVETLRRFWTMIAHSQGWIWRPDLIEGSLCEEREVVDFLFDHFENMFLLRKLPAWSGKPSQKRELFKVPKVYVRDCGVLHTLVGIVDYEDLISHDYFHKSWEGSVVEHILSSLPPLVKASYYRTSSAAEIELVLEFAEEVWALCISSSSVLQIYDDFPQSCEDVRATRRFCVYTGHETYPCRYQSTAITLADFITTLREYSDAGVLAA